MSTTEFLVIAVGLFLGYWIVSRLIGGRADVGPTKGDAAGPASTPTDGSSGESWHDVLEVDRAASINQIRAAYKALISQYHPDKVATLGQEIREVAERRSKQINAAYREAMRERGVE